MAANNQALMIGRVGRDPESRQAGSTTLTKFSLAVDRAGKKDGNGHKITDWLQVKVWGKQAELASGLIRKGAQVSVSGAINIETWEKDGVKQTSVVLNADSFHLLDKRQDAAPQTSDRQRAAQFDEDDIPLF